MKTFILIIIIGVLLFFGLCVNVNAHTNYTECMAEAESEYDNCLIVNKCSIEDYSCQRECEKVRDDRKEDCFMKYIYGDTPETPETPQTSQTPQTPETPQTPQTPETPQTPQAPETPQTPQTPQTPETPTGTTTFEEAPDIPIWPALENITNWLFSLFLAVAVICFLITGYMFLTAGGNPETLGKAKTFLLYAIIGVVIGLAAKGIVGFLRGILGG